MQFIRNIAWIIVTALLVAFIAMNWTPASVNFWPLENGNYLHVDWPVGFVALLFFILGMVPVWLYARAIRWRLNRRITSLENTLRTTSELATAQIDLEPKPAPVVAPAPTVSSTLSPESSSESLQP